MVITELKDSILLSIRPGFAQEIYDGKKTVELRKVFPKEYTKFVFLIETNGIRKLTGYFEISEVHVGGIEDNWKLLDRHNVDHDRYQRYFQSWTKGHVVRIKNPVQLKSPIDLREIINVCPDFRVPQNFTYLKRNPRLLQLILDHILTDGRDKQHFRLKPIQKGYYSEFRKLVLEHIGRYYDDIDNRFVDKLLNTSELGEDPFGYFTVSKSVFSVYFQKQRIGYTCLTYKRGNAVKTGPTIFFENFRNKGIGQKFRSFVDSFLRSQGVRKVYCTCPDMNIPTVCYLLRSNFRIEAHSQNQYNMKNGEIVFGKMLTNTSEKSISFQRQDSPVTSIHINRLSKQSFNKFFRGAFSRYYFKIDEDFGSRLVNSLTNLESEDIFYMKGKICFTGYFKGTPHSLCVVSPKRGGVCKLTFVIRTSNVDASLELISRVERHLIERGIRKLFTAFPLTDISVTQLFKLLGYSNEGILTEPYQRGVDFVQVSKFL